MEVNNKTVPVTGQQDQNTISLDLMNRMKLHGMAEAFRESLAGTTPQSMTADTFLSMLLAREWDYRSQAAIARLTKNAAFRYKAYIEQIDYATNRGLDRNQMERLATLDFVHKAQNLFITGSSGTGKSYLACALGHEACKKGFRTFYANAPKLLGALKVAKVKGTLEAELKKIERCQLLILDDLFIVPLDAKERPILLEIIEDRHERKSVIITSQYPSSNWYDMVGDPTIADAILDRIIHTAHTIELCVEYNISNQLLDDYYRRCGSNWGNVGLALEIAKTSGRHMREVCDYYKRYHRNGWNRILVEIGIKPGSMYYDPFYDRICYHSECWHEHYCSYCDHHDKHHRKHYKKHRHHKHHKWHDDDDDWDDDDEDD